MHAWTGESVGYEEGGGLAVASVREYRHSISLPPPKWFLDGEVKKYGGDGGGKGELGSPEELYHKVKSIGYELSQKKEKEVYPFDVW